MNRKIHGCFSDSPGFMNKNMLDTLAVAFHAGRLTYILRDVPEENSWLYTQELSVTLFHTGTVSYTHLDVYKRQIHRFTY